MSAYVLSNGQRVYPAFVLNDADGGGIVTPPASFRLADGTQVMGVVLVDEDGNIAPAGLSEAQVQAVAGADALSVIEPVDGRLFVGSSAPSANTAYLSLFRLVESRTVSTIAVQHASPSGNGDVGIYRFDGSNYIRMGSSGSTALSGSNAIQAIALTASVDLSPDTDYWLAFAADNGVTTLYRTLGLTGSFGRGNKALSKGTSFPLPATISSPSATGYVPYLGAE